MFALLLGLVIAGLPGFAESAGGVQWTTPEGWVDQGSRPMRAATYEVKDAECAVYYFGPGQGGGVDANVERWLGQFEAEGSPKIEKRTIHGLAVTTVDVHGTYLGAGGPMATGKIRKPDYRMLAAVVEAAKGNVFFKFTGPEETIDEEQERFHAMLESLNRPLLPDNR